MKYTLFLFGFLLIFFSCNSPKESNDAIKDESSFANIDEVKINHLDWKVNVDFAQETLQGVATYTLEKHAADKIILDTSDDLQIDSVLINQEKTTSFHLGDEVAGLGKPLEIDISPNTHQISVFYKTSPNASALQWLPAQQTAGKKHPYLLTQGQAILTRSYIPIQDTPGIRITYNAEVTVPKELLPLMSAKNPTKKNETGVYQFEMKQPIPPYLIALAVGDIEYQAIDQRTGVYAEPSVLNFAAEELSEMDDMVTAAEGLYGAYAWEQFDVLILPPSFPFGGMENPRLTFATPTILAGDKSLTNLIAHELAHSWSGNLVTNATWNDFWLNEGFTVYFERRIMEAIKGKEYAEMLDVIGYQDLERTVNEMGHEHPYTSLEIDLGANNPDDAFSDVPYEKGYLFLKTLEEKYGRNEFDKFLKNYFAEHAFQSITTPTFLTDLEQTFGKLETEFINTWIHQPGMPEVAVPKAKKFEAVEQALKKWTQGEVPAKEMNTENWSTYEWMHFLRNLPQDTPLASLQKLDNEFNFSNSGNSEILALWIEKNLLAKNPEILPAAEKFLMNVGRRKFLTPLYQAFLQSGQAAEAVAIYQKARPNYHAVSARSLDELLHDAMHAHTTK